MTDDERKQAEQSRTAYPRNTLGYHYEFAKVIFGEDSRAVSYLRDKAALEVEGFNAPVVQPEEQVVHLLAHLHFAGR